jgi:hypothetical protein
MPCKHIPPLIAPPHTLSITTHLRTYNLLRLRCPIGHVCTAHTCMLWNDVLVNRVVQRMHIPEHLLQA